MVARAGKATEIKGQGLFRRRELAGKDDME